MRPLRSYCEAVARACELVIPPGYPVFGRDAFRTATGVHAAAIRKAHARGDAWLADLVYSGVPARDFGRGQELEIGPLSGRANVLSWLEGRGVTPTSSLVEDVLRAAKRSDRALTALEVMAIVDRHAETALDSPSPR